ncbi:OmpA family protein [Paracoccus laeviglucosivorans]|uniref:OmpA-OmpF porin, OOP family n=1 Tax=Paracoccus laeviglucosivorans TaxID=1197861 RepID=A0A521AUS4_9RHOB|nr:OmpA family protein [Paracoccus laeviglucosivorans]SMO38598.1 OmpA-OmpF porin, OOP family [Paracoccus laeviglucosivorans]
MANSGSRRGTVVVASLLALAAAGGLSFLSARAAADFIEDRSAADVAEALRLGGYDWVTVQTDGLQVRLTGTAPDEVQRFRARSRAATVVEEGRVLDQMQVKARADMEMPAFGIELLRNDDSISIVGLVPAAMNHNAMAMALNQRTGVANISNLVETADYPVPQGWDAAYQFGLRSTELARRAKVSVTPGKVVVRAVADGPREKHDLEVALQRAKPAGVTLDAEVSAPRPVIAPFTLRFVKDGAGARFDACAADSEGARARILKAGTDAGIKPEPQCTLGLGAPSNRWADAAVPAIEAVDALGAGWVTLSDTDVALFAPADITAQAFDEAVGRLEGALPAAFTLTTEHEQKADLPQGPAEFAATVNAGTVMLRGRIGDDRMREAVESLARSRFGTVDSALRVDPGVPDGWTMRAIGAIEALDGLDHGKVTVSPDMIRLNGVSGSQTASDAAAARLSKRLGAGARYELAIRYDRRLDPLLGLPSGLECVDQLNAAMKESEIGFEPNKSVIAGDPADTLGRMSATMQNCSDYRIELGGHTDSQGREEMNAELSRARAQAVLDAMREHGVDVTYMTAKGYGESQPVADNETDAGREANRRIEFTLLADDPVVTETPAPAEKVSGVTETAEITAQKQARAASVAATGAIGGLLPAPGSGGASAELPPEAAATLPASAAIDGEMLLRITDALTVPASQAAFPDNNEGSPEQAQSAIPAAVLPAIVPLGVPAPTPDAAE